MYAAVFEEGIDSLIRGRKEPAPIRIVVDHEKGTKGRASWDIMESKSLQITGAESLGTSTCRLEVDGLNDKVFIDAVDATTFMPVFAKRGTYIRRYFRAHLTSYSWRLTPRSACSRKPSLDNCICVPLFQPS